MNSFQYGNKMYARQVTLRYLRYNRERGTVGSR